MGLHSLTAHPFTISSNPEETGKTSEMAFYVKQKRGITSHLANKAARSPGCSKLVLLDGPYGGLNTRIDEYNTILVIAGGSGAGFSLGVIDATFRSFKENNTQQRTIQIVFSTRHAGTAEWYDGQIESIVSSSNRSGCIHLSKSIHITCPQHSIAADTEKQTASVPARVGRQDRLRPDIPAVISKAANENASKTIGIFACGPASMLQDARGAAAEAQKNLLCGGQGDAYLHTENFS